MRKRFHLSVIAILIAMPVITDSALEFWTAPTSDAGAIGEVISAGKDLTRWKPKAPSRVLGTTESTEKTVLAEPISNARDRVTLKTFGMEIHPETSPVPNDRFDGIHVGVDFETTEDEMEIDVPVFATCEGPLQFKAKAKGYGGVAVQACVIDGREVSVIYGHLDFTSIEPGFGQFLKPGQRIGVLGQGFSEETDGVRKHLHLGIRERVDIEEVDIRGYVKDSEEAARYLDALLYIQQ